MGFGSKDKDIGNDKHTDETTVREAIDKANEILEMIENDVSERRKTGNSANFFESVIEGATGVRDTIERVGRVSDKQLKALSGWYDAIDKIIQE
jgi:hypothetical protein